MTPKKIIIHGVHRSGTSLTANLVEKMGAWFARPDQQMPSRGDNIKGFWERLDVVAINDAILQDCTMSWNSLKPGLPENRIDALADKYGQRIQAVVEDLNTYNVWLLKDPRLSFTWPVWQRFVGDNTYHIFVTRHPLAVARSLEKRNAMPLQCGLAFWTQQNLAILRHLRSEQSTCHILFDRSQDQLLKLVETLGEFLNSDSPALNQLSEAQIDTIIDRSLIHQSGAITQENQLLPATEKLWQQFEQGNINSINPDTEVSPDDLGWALLDSSFNSQTLTEELQTSYETTLTSERRQNKQHYLEIKEALQHFHQSRSYLLAQKLLTPMRWISGPQKNALDKIASVLDTALLNTSQRKQDESEAAAEQTDTQQNRAKSPAVLLIQAMLKNPLLFARKLSPARIATGLKVLSGKQPEGFNLRQALTNYSAIPLAEQLELSLFEDDIQLEDLEFAQYAKPLISIVIPVYNNYSTTLSCLKSIIENTGDDLPYEIVIADDSSTDETTELQDKAGITVIKTPENLGFLGNCNNACNSVNGEYIVLLNNDTNVQPGWLSELYCTIDQDESIGVVGPMFLYPDGRLQEAGGIIFSDASGYNYGRLDHPLRPEYQFQRSVDYISGACLMFRQSDWRELDGFDTRFTPAYYEDTDLCFAMRANDKSVCYVPTARVVHFEGVSHGTDTNSGIKAYQETNRTKFLEKWRDVLQQDHQPDSSNLFVSRTQQKNRATVLVIDHYVPFYDKDAGSRSTFMYLQLMVDSGLRVLFMGDNFYPHQPYTATLQKMGIEVLYGDQYRLNWFDWLQTNSQYIDSIYLHRPDTTNRYIDKLRQLEHQPRLVYFGHDLHFLRLQRQTEVGMKNETNLSIDEWRELELSVMRKCDISLYPSQFEADTVKQIAQDITVDTIPLNWYDNNFDANQVRCNSQPNLLFVGGFGHPPNKDGLQWFLDKVFADVVAAVPEVTLTIIGSRCPDEIFALANNNIRVLGEVSDQQLNESYQYARAAVVPLRFGAGVKGKVLEAMASGIPVMTTSIGSEGLPGEPDSYLSIADDHTAFAQQTIALLRDDTLCKHYSQSGYDVLQQHFSRASASKLIDYFTDQ